MRKRILSVMPLIMLILPLTAQSENPATGTIGLTFTAIGNNDLTNWARRTLEGGPSYDGNGFYSLGFSYLQPLGSRIDLETGIEFSSQTILIIPNLPPNICPARNTEKISLINIPLTARFNFLNHLFINGGFFLGMDAGISNHLDSQTGIGALLGIGGSYTFDYGLGAFVNLYQKYHSLISFETGSNEYRWRLVDGGLRIGITYNLPGS